MKSLGNLIQWLSCALIALLLLAFAAGLMRSRPPRDVLAERQALVAALRAAADALEKAKLPAE